jgi:hypothetical protein
MNFIDKISNIYKTNKNIEIYIDMDGTIVELLFDKEGSYTKKGVYLNKRPIIPVVNKLEEIKNKFPLIKFKILSCSKTNQMRNEKNEWLNIQMPYIKKEDRVIFSEEAGDYAREDRNLVKAEYINKNIDDDKIIILIDDDIEVLKGVQNLNKENVLPVHVTSILI